MGTALTIISVIIPLLITIGLGFFSKKIRGNGGRILIMFDETKTN